LSFVGLVTATTEQHDKQYLGLGRCRPNLAAVGKRGNSTQPFDISARRALQGRQLSFGTDA
jgi:hypothetical protein